MRIAILGTRGIPNNYGGFEQFAELVSQVFVNEGHEVVVYNPSDHPYVENSFNGITIKRIYSNEGIFGCLNTFIFDFLCFRDAGNREFDIILALGYHPASLFFQLVKKKSKIVTNMAGMEWKRSKWNWLAKFVIRYCEKRAVLDSDMVVADNEGIANYYAEVYGNDAPCIAYGAVLPKQPTISQLELHNVIPNKYLMLIARYQPDNNFEMILDGYCLSNSEEPFVVVGNCNNNYGKFLKKKYKHVSKIRFVGPIYNYQELSSLRFFSRLYFHGHSCGGTNPSLLEAMASKGFIAAHENEFNRSVLKGNAFYFVNAEVVAELIDHASQCDREKWAVNNLEKIQLQYNWDIIASQYLDLFKKILTNSK